MAKEKVRCPRCNQRVKARRAADRKRSSCPNCGAWFAKDDDDDLLQLDALPPVADPPPRARPARADSILHLEDLPVQAARPIAQKRAATREKTKTKGAVARDLKSHVSFTQIKAHLVSERFDPVTRQRLFQRLLEAYEEGLSDPELLYLGARYGVSLGRVAAAQFFIGRLSELLKENDQASPAYFPVGLLSLSIASSEKERAEILSGLQRLAGNSDRFAKVLRLVGGVQPEQMLPQSPPGLLRDIELNVNGMGSEVLQLIQAETKGSGAMNPLKEAQRSAQAASETYHAGELTGARHALEAMLLIDGDQSSVLRNLITITSEQQDLEAYERYWRRYVKVLLWRIMRNDDAPVAYDELLRFYSRVATVTDREFSETAAKPGDKLRTPGLLARWLEAHAGLIWLGSITRSYPERQASLASARLAQGWLGHLGLMKYWCRVFYPEFYRHLDVGVPADSAGVADLWQSHHSSYLTFDPALNLLTRFVEWHNIGFDLDFEPETQEILDNEHTEMIMALVGCVSRVSVQPYVPQLHAKLDADERNPVPFRRLWQEACSRPFQARRNKFLTEKNWSALVALYGEGRPDPELLDRLTPMSRLILACALCHTQRTLEGFEIACQVLPDMMAEEFLEESQLLDWWRGAFNMNLEQVVEAGGDLNRLSEQLRRVPPLDDAPNFIAERLKEIADFESRFQFDAIMEDLKSHIKDGNFETAVQLVKGLSETGPEARDRKHSLLEQVQLEQAFDQCGPLVRDAKFKEAKTLVRRLQVSSTVGKERRDEIIGQIETAEKNYKESERVTKLVDEAINRAKACIGRGAFTEARQVINRLPDAPSDLVELKQDFLKQIDKLENDERINAQVEGAVKRAKDFVAQGAYDKARQAIRRLPNKPSDLAELKQNYLEQIDKAENDERLNSQVEDAIERAKAFVAKGSYNDARNVIRKLPDTLPDLVKMKRDFLGQISKLEKDERDVMRENAQIMTYLMSRNVDFTKVEMIARENKIDKNNHFEYNSLLKAIQKQIRGF